MAESFTTLAQGLMNLEINTIIKANMSGVKLPGSRRQALYELAAIYHHKLDDLRWRQPIYWQYAGMRSFDELYARATVGIDALEKQLKKPPRNEHERSEQQIVRENISALERIKDQSSQIVGMFKLLEQDFANKNEEQIVKRKNRILSTHNLLYFLKRQRRVTTEVNIDVNIRMMSQQESDYASRIWNNDIDESQLQGIEDLSLIPDQIVVLQRVLKTILQEAKQRKIAVEEAVELSEQCSQRQLLYNIAKIFHEKLKELNIREPIYWQYGGKRSFDELSFRAERGIEKFKRELKKPGQNTQQSMYENIKYLQYIQHECSRIIGFFGVLEQRIEQQRDERTEEQQMNDGYFIIRALPDISTEEWNNDIDRERMNEIADLDLTIDQITLIRKAWELGTEQIMLQTVIQIDGDVTTRMSERFAMDFNQTVLSIHNNSISTSTLFWANLVKTLSEMAGRSLGLFR
jgi:hypothetical protein